MERTTGLNALLLAIGSLFLLPIAAQASPLDVDALVWEYASDVTIGETQLWVDVTEPVSGRASFTFHNDGSQPCRISEVYFDDGSLFNVRSITGSGTVFFSDSRPANLPGGDLATPPFLATFSFQEDSTAGGVDPGEYLTIVFNLKFGRTISDIADDFYSGALRIGIRAKGFASGGAASFVNDPPVCPDGDGDDYGDPASIWCDYHELDCNDSNPNVNPGAAEKCNGIDDNCDGNTDEGFNVGMTCTDGLGICETSGTYVCTGDGLGTECNAVPGTPQVEGPAEDPTCDDELDNDCDGDADGADPDCTAGGCARSVAASTVDTSLVHGSSDLAKHLAYILLPIGAVIGLGIWRRKR